MKKYFVIVNIFLILYLLIKFVTGIMVLYP